MERIGIVGCGSIGRAWAVVFARGGHRVAIWDQEPAATAGALAFVQSALAALASAGLVDEEPRTVAARVEAMLRIEDVLAGAEYVQESTAEDLEVKRQVFATMDALAPERCILASSTST